jgi:hypothetical protein
MIVPVETAVHIETRYGDRPDKAFLLDNTGRPMLIGIQVFKDTSWSAERFEATFARKNT